MTRREQLEGRAIVRFYLRTQCNGEPNLRRPCPSRNPAHDRARGTDPRKAKR